MPSHRKFALYFTWDKGKEAGKPLEKLNNRFPALYELRRTAWPMLRNLNGGEQGIAGFLDRVVLEDFAMFINTIRSETSVDPTIIASRELDGTGHSISEAVATNAHTLIVVSLDHFDTKQAPTAEDLNAIRAFLTKPHRVLAVCPHHYIGGDVDEESANDTGDVFNRRVQEHRHHADPLVPAVQRIGGYARSLLNGLGLPVDNIYGLRPATEANGEPIPLVIDRSLDVEGFLGGKGRHLVSTFNAHPHLPHLQPVGPAIAAYRVLACQSVSLDADPHPFTSAGNSKFNALLWAPPTKDRQGHVLVCDATLWSAAFKGVAGITNFWRNLAAMSVE